MLGGRAAAPFYVIIHALSEMSFEVRAGKADKILGRRRGFFASGEIQPKLNR
jgi:hypothetical protein